LIAFSRLGVPAANVWSGVAAPLGQNDSSVWKLS
jgi:hypothetical protein